MAERRAAFELALADALRPLVRTPTDPDRRQPARRGTARRARHVRRGRRRTQHLLRAARLEAARRLELSGNTFPIDAFGAEVAAAGRAGEVIAITDVRIDPRTIPYQDAYLMAMGVTASLLVPLVKSGRLLAFLALGHEQPAPLERGRDRARARHGRAHCGPRSTSRAPTPRCARSATAAS
jgi:GAF domain-containing protein